MSHGLRVLTLLGVAVVSRLAGQVSAQPAAGDIQGFFPQFVLGAGVQSTIVLVNPSTVLIGGTVEFFDRIGNPWPVVIGEVSHGNGQTDFRLPPGGTVYLSPETGDRPLATGWVRIRADGNVRASILYAGATGLAGLPAVDAGLEFAIPVESGGDRARTGLALAVPDGKPAIVRLTLLQPNGQTAANGVATIEAGGRDQSAAYVDELLPQADLSDFQGSLRIESDARVALAALHTTSTELSPLPVEPLDQTHFFSFENDLNGWRPRTFDVDNGAIADWEIAPTEARADDGRVSLLLLLDNSTDAGKIFVQHPFLVEPDRPYRVKVSYSFATKDFGDLNLWRIITGVSPTPPAKPDDLVYQGDTGHGSPSDIGYVWLDRSYEFDTRSGPDGLLYVSVGVWGTFETLRGYFLDGLTVTIRANPAPNP